MKTCSGTERCIGLIAVWMTKTQQNNLSQNLPQFIFTLAARGLEELFSSCAAVSVFGSGGKYVLVLPTYVLRVQ